MALRKEKDFIGEKDVPKNAYWGVHTQRAIDNFPFSNLPTPNSLIHALALVKKACALANCDIGAISQAKAAPILQACDEIAQGRHNDQFPVDGLQGGAGTSTNMNINEVIANRANEILGFKKGDYTPVHPLEDVNLHQSTNDVYPTAFKTAAIYGFRNLSAQIELLQGALQKKELEFARVIKIGRTELQGAVPITLGAEFSVFAEAIARDRWRTHKCEERLRVVNLGGTAVGTGLAAPRRYIFLVAEKLRETTNLGLTRAENAMDPTANADALVEVSGILKAHAANIIKICEDLRKLQLFGEITLEPLQAGSSIMPNKVNPVLLEAGIQVGLKALANDFLVTEAATRGTLQICEFLPLAALALLESLEILARFDCAFARHVEKIQANETLCRENFEQHPMLITAFLPHLGYDKASELARQFAASGEKNLRVYLEKRLGKTLVEQTLSTPKLMSLGYEQP